MTDRKIDQATKRFFEDFAKNGVPKIDASRIAVTLIDAHSAGSTPSPKQAIELGAILLLDKPLIICALPGETVPSRLARAADIILWDFDPNDPASQARMRDAIKGLDEALEV